MDIKEVKEKKAALEKLISMAIFDYEREAECRVDGIHLVPFRTFGGEPTPQLIVIDVTVD